MKLTVKNLGPIPHAEIDLGKDLIILTGENNTGKTYLANTIYAFFSPYRIDPNGAKQWFNSSKGNNYSSQEEIWEFNIVEKFCEIISKALAGVLPLKFSTTTNQFDNLKIDIELSDREYIFDALKKLEFIKIEKSKGYNEGEPNAYIASLDKEENNLMVSASVKSNDKTIFNKGLIELAFLAQTFRELIQESLNVTFITTERTGINLLHKELSIIKNKTFDSLLENGKRNVLINFFNTRFNKYPQSIKDAIQNAQNLDAIKNSISEFKDLADELDVKFMNGKIQISEEGDIQFIDNVSQKNIEVHMTSSTIKSLASLSIFLRHIAKKGDFIIIDEPEANLHPNNQIKIARFIARLVNEGFKVMISTHSDYIMRELNNLIMLGSGNKKEPETTKELLTKYPEYSTNQLLSHKQVGVYLFRQGQDVENVKISETGFEIATIDETVDRLNETSQNIFYELFD